MPLFNLLLPSLIDTITSEEFDKFDYAIYFGSDIGDALYDNDGKIEEVYKLLQSKCPLIKLMMYSFGNTKVDDECS